MTPERGHVPVFPIPSHEGTTETVRVTGVWIAHCKGGCNVFASCTQASCNVTSPPPSMRSLFSHPLNQDWFFLFVCLPIKCHRGECASSEPRNQSFCVLCSLCLLIKILMTKVEEVQRFSEDRYYQYLPLLEKALLWKAWDGLLEHENYMICHMGCGCHSYPPVDHKQESEASQDQPGPS